MRRSPRGLAGAPGPAAINRDQDSCSTTQSMQPVSAATSAGSIAGNMPTRSWLRPSLRYGSTSTIPLARSTLASVVASTSLVKSIVPTTSERWAGSLTNGVANGDACAHPYSREDDSVVRSTHQGSPPPAEPAVLLPAEPAVLLPAEPAVLLPAEPAVLLPAEPAVLLP